jgi:cation:H+ antiporter
MLYILYAFLATLPWFIVKFTIGHTNPILQTLLTGSSIIGAGFMLTWASDGSRKFISGALAIAIVALLAVLPEYSVDIYLSWKAGINEEYTHYAVANMTGANRLLIGIGWTVILFVHFLKTKKSEIAFDRSLMEELIILFAATVWSINIFFKKNISLVDSLILGGLFIFYILRASKKDIEELEEDFEPVKTIQSLPPKKSIPLIIFMFLWAGFSIFISAEAFAEGLINIGKNLGVSEFLLIQWLAPLASEAPEFVVTLIWATRGRGQDAMRALVSSKVNQWTLLIACIPIAFIISKIYHSTGDYLSPMPMDSRQQWEILLTAAQSLLAFFILLDLNFSVIEASILLILFLSQFIFEHIREEITFIYFALCMPMILYKFGKIKIPFGKK